jgi:hypothetical protein
MKGKWFIVALLCTAFLSFYGCSQIPFYQPTSTPTSTATNTPTLEPTITPSPTQSGKWISSNDGFITFQGIPGFITVQQGNLIASLSPNADLATGPVIAILHGTFDEMGLGNDLDEVAMNLTASSDFGFSSTSYSSFRGFTAIMVDYSTTINNTPLTGQMVLFVVNDNNLVIFIATAPTTEWSIFQDYLEPVMDSIQLME